MTTPLVPRVLCTTWVVPGADVRFLPRPESGDAAGADVRVRVLPSDPDPAVRTDITQFVGGRWEAYARHDARRADGLHVLLDPHGLYRLPLGFRMAMPPSIFALLAPRSSLVTRGVVYDSSGDATGRGLIVPHGTGVIDPDYTDEWQLQVATGAHAVTLTHGDRVGQLVLLPRLIGQFVQGADDARPARGGFGSTGVQ